MADDLPEAIEHVDPDWRPSREADVERALRGLERLAARFVEVQTNAREWRADINEWEAQQIASLSAQATIINNALEAWALEMRRVKGTATFSFPSGTIETRKVVAKTIVDDEAEVIAWCREVLPAAVKVEVSLLKSVIAKQCEMTPDGRFVTPDGEIVPGVHQQILPDSAASATVKLASQRALPKAGA